MNTKISKTTISASLTDWHTNTELCVDIKTLLLSDRRTKHGKMYQGLLRCDDEYHYTFVEIQLPPACKRNPRVFDGKYITLTRRDDGTLRLNFRPVRMEDGFSTGSYATGVANEILWALTSLLGK